MPESIRLAEKADESALVEFRQGDATQLSLRSDEWGKFDLAHARFVLEHVPQPLEVVKVMVRALCPGGTIILQDDAHDTLRATPEPTGFGRLWDAYQQSYIRPGNDPRIGHRLVTLLDQAGAKPVRNTWLFFGGCLGEDLFQALIDNLLQILQGARATIVKARLLEVATIQAALEAIQCWRSRTGAALWYAVS